MSELTIADLQLLERLNDQPHLKRRLEQLLSMVEDAGIVKADEAERRVREAIRRLGNETLTGWAQKQSANEAILKEDGVRSGKKTLLAYHLWRNSSNRTGI